MNLIEYVRKFGFPVIEKQDRIYASIRVHKIHETDIELDGLKNGSYYLKVSNPDESVYVNFEMLKEAIQEIESIIKNTNMREMD